MKKHLIIVLLTALILKQMNANAQSPDIGLTIHESTINKLLTAIGTIADTGDYKVLFVKGKYNWSVNDAKVKLEKGKALFIAKVRVETGPFNYADYLEGDMDVEYNPETNKLTLTLKSAIFKIQTKVFKKKVVIKTIDIADYYNEPIVFDGPIAMEQEFEMTMPDGSVKRLEAEITDCKIYVLPGKIDMKAIMEFTDPLSKELKMKKDTNTQKRKPEKKKD